MLANILADEKDDLDLEAYNASQLSLADEVLKEVANEDLATSDEVSHKPKLWSLSQTVVIETMTL